MKISYRWLQEYIECQISADELAHLLTMAGLEVEGREDFSFRIPEHVVVGEILDVQAHPDAQKLSVCQVDTGEDAARTIVCGAPNAIADAKVAVALPGAVLPNGMKILDTEIREIVSSGMLCAEDELGIGNDHSGILHLHTDVPGGTPLTARLLGLPEDDTVLEIGLTPNRGDCLSHIGIARELSALLDVPLRSPFIDYPEEGPEVSEQIDVSIESPELCHRYTAGVISGVTIAPSPLWLKSRLESLGVRSINNVVDVTNLVMMELGQPLHAFDLDLVKGRKILVRRADDGERFVTLDGVERQLDDSMLMIADGEKNVAIGGVMGGQNSEISDSTTEILLESARFEPSNIRKTAKKLALSTESSYRFERCVDVQSTDLALQRAIKLIAELGGGRVCRGLLDVYPTPHVPVKVTLRFARVSGILGVDIPSTVIEKILSGLGFQTLECSEESLTVEVPSYRSDVEREIDLVEEVGRVYGFDNIPAALPSGEIPPRVNSVAKDVEHVLRESLLRQGLHEVINYSFFDKNSLGKLGIDKKNPYDKVVPLRNPLTNEQSVLRTTTIPGLLENFISNRSNRVENIRLFEIGKIFLSADEGADVLPEEKLVVSGVLSGQRQEFGWNQRQEAVDFYDLKGIVENVLRQLHIPYFFRRLDSESFLHPGESAVIRVDDETLGILGKIHPDVSDAFDLPDEEVYVFELCFDVLVHSAKLQAGFNPLPKYPEVHRDLAVIVPLSRVEASEVESIIFEVGQPLLEKVVLVDRYVGPQVGDENASLTYSLCYRSAEKTLTDREVAGVHQRIIAQLEARAGLRLR
ncbi:phenylalanine--tRNA ligase subunit beta [candidate division KSB3 bacterium]|uniref:Phenylalanine--tRNA ligase beta subunit n=1 Tax=candidate division KSB3 bacterium TaxID=2044937 RepID=A0A2G6EBB5_9BACT|nr:MAG: phenylalanine--tRNA ligase subunit beta [candidate division KSB3 bacterium]PIE30791.1 MAG: phenylalanine--tRNA ligase subunit beta [candidate division KSB3 bacterium]